MKLFYLGISIFALIAVAFFMNSTEPVQVVHPPKKIITIVKSNDLDFWKLVELGTKSAETEFHANTLFWAPSSEKNVDQQIALLEKAINEKPDAIILAASDYQRLVPLARKVRENGIHLLTLDSSLPDHISEGHIATDNIKAAEQAADYLAKLGGEKGKFAIISSVEGTATAIERQKGFLQAIKKYPNIQVIDIKYSGSNIKEAYRLTKKILKDHPDLKGIFGINELTTDGIAQAIEEAGKASTIKTLGFDSSPQILHFIEEGVLSATVVQEPFNMGYLAIQQAVSILDGKEKGKLVYTDSKIITKENMYSPENQKLLFPFDNQDKD